MLFGGHVSLAEQSDDITVVLLKGCSIEVVIVCEKLLSNWQTRVSTAACSISQVWGDHTPCETRLP
jgi:hypothetical protein